jgi:uncharacterized protein (TIGR02001 family)
MKLKTRFGVAAALLTLSGFAQAEFSGNIGFTSDYYFRGVFQKESSASGGVDYENGGFFAGVWTADVGGGVTGDGLEVDYYLGYGTEIKGFGLGVGYTGYTYTGDFDDTYQEINLSASYGFVSFDIAVGEYLNFGGPTLDYEFYSMTAEHKGFWGQYGMFDNDFDGDYFQFGYNTSLAEVDLGISLLVSDENLVGESEEALIFTIGKSFDF